MAPEKDLQAFVIKTNLMEATWGLFVKLGLGVGKVKEIKGGIVYFTDKAESTVIYYHPRHGYQFLKGSAQVEEAFKVQMCLDKLLAEDELRFQKGKL